MFLPSICSLFTSITVKKISFMRIIGYLLSPTTKTSLPKSGMVINGIDGNGHVGHDATEMDLSLLRFAEEFFAVNTQHRRRSQSHRIPQHSRYIDYILTNRLERVLHQIAIPIVALLTSLWIRPYYNLQKEGTHRKQRPLRSFNYLKLKNLEAINTFQIELSKHFNDVNMISMISTIFLKQ